MGMALVTTNSQNAGAQPEGVQESSLKQSEEIVLIAIQTFTQSKKWGMNPENRKCDAPGSWYCTGDYPPALTPLIEKRRSFAQIEDFNKKGGEKSAYTKLIEKQQRGEI